MCKRQRLPCELSFATSDDLRDGSNINRPEGSDSCDESNELPGYIVREIKRLQPHLRCKAFQDLVGISKSFQENEVAEIMGELEIEISRRSTHRSAYDRACSMSKEYVSTQLLACLRADEFNPKAAARRVLSHFQKKLELFGSERLLRDILLSDLEEDDMESLISGAVQFLGVKDRAGRLVMVRQYSSMKYRNKLNMVSPNRIE